MTLGLAPKQGDLLRSTVSYCEGRVAADSIYAVLHRECFTLFPDEMFADLFTDVGRRSVPPMIVAVVMVLQRIEGCSDREAVDRFAFDARWKYAAGGLDFDYPGFVHTVLQPALPTGQLDRELAAAAVRPVRGVLGRIQTLRLGQQRLDLPGQLGLGPHHPVVAHRPVPARRRPHLGPIQGDPSQRHQPGLHTSSTTGRTEPSVQ